MTEHTERECPECGQRLRFPKDVGGLLMACPSCGKKFNSDFKLGGANKQKAQHRGFFTTLFELPYNIISHIGRLLFPK
jgi:predicted amidophosphoribosyltransferase